MSSVHNEENLITPYGQRLYVQMWQPGKNAKGCVIIIHGYNEHSGRYKHVVRYLLDNNYAVCAYDLRGHGLSEGPRSHVHKFYHYVDDLYAIYKKCHDMDDSLPIFFLGHSLGALIVLHALLDERFSVTAAALSSPFLGLGFELSPLKELAGRLLNRISEKIPLSPGFSGSALSHDEQIVKQYDKDPLVNKKATVGWFMETQAAQLTCLDKAAEFQTPLLFLPAGADTVANPRLARELFEQVLHEDKHFVEYPKSYHEVLNEPEYKQEALAEIVSWFQRFSG